MFIERRLAPESFIEHELGGILWIAMQFVREASGLGLSRSHAGTKLFRQRLFLAGGSFYTFKMTSRLFIGRNVSLYWSHRFGTANHL